jgi:hypothetical protein
MNKELLKEALDAIEGLFYGYEEMDREKVILTVEKIEKELLNTKPDPVAIFQGKRTAPDGTNEFFGYLLVDNMKEGSKLYASPPKREPLSDDEIYEIHRKLGDPIGLYDLSRSIEKAHGIGE